MTFLASILFLLLTAYSVLIFRITSVWDKISDSSPCYSEQLFRPSVSIVIPARNEERNIGQTIDAVLSQDYPSQRIEIIVVDDHSDDRTAEIAGSYQDKLCLIRLSEVSSFPGSKKLALGKGIVAAGNELVITLDADCVPATAHWLKSMVNCLHSKNLNAVTGPVRYQSDGSLWQNFIASDNAGMMLVTAFGYHKARFFMANGANLCFRREIFNTIQGYDGNEHLASGDDMFLFEKIEKQFPGSTGFVADRHAIVSTLPPVDLSTWLQQRIRWGTKNSKMQSVGLKATLLLVFTANVALLLIPFILPVLSKYVIACLILSVLVKFVSDYRLINRGAAFLEQKNVMTSYTVSALVYPVLLALSGILSLMLKQYTWKGRRTK